MSELKGRVGTWQIEWVTVPRGSSGMAQARVNGEVVEVRWQRDSNGIAIELPHGNFGFDIEGETDEEGRRQFRVARRESDQFWTGLSFTHGADEAAMGGTQAKKKGVRVRAQMPGKIVRVLVKDGQAVEKDQPLLVMEAMKMENEIRAQAAGQVKSVKVADGQAVETGADLVILE
jgi:biotin carboxyl carrier protein